MSFPENLPELLKLFATESQVISSCEHFEKKVAEVRIAAEWPWSEQVGVYYFRIDEGVLYVGRALPGTKFGGRIWNHLQPGDEEWGAALERDDAVVGFVPVPEERWYLAAALELFLIETLTPRWNARRG